MTKPATIRRVCLVTQMLDLKKKLQDPTLSHEKTLLTRQVETANGAIDKRVNELYGLTTAGDAVIPSSSQGLFEMVPFR